MGVAVGDPFGSGRPSLFVTNFGGEPNSLFRNVEGTVFEDAAERSGVAAAGMPFVRWGTHFADFDNDGWPDLYAVGGHLAPRIVRWLGHYKSSGAKYVEAGDPSFSQRTLLLHNDGSGRFTEWKDSGDLARWHLSGRGSAVADIDNDGDLDLAVASINGPARLFENLIGSRKSWIRIAPEVGADRKTVLGTEVTVTAGGRSQVQQFWVSPSYASGSLTDLHFGLGEAQSVETIEVRWPEGTRETFHGVAARRIYRIRRGSGLIARP
jgi:enediyne biosynthesis protein E4